MKTNIYLLIFVVAIASLVWWSADNNADTDVVLESTGNSQDEVVVYKSPYCGCCVEHIAYMRENGFKVKVEEVDDLSSIKKKYGIPGNMESCHTTIVGDYFIEGHIPIEAINKLLSEKPEINGISLPGMPSGSPGMPGVQTEDWIINSIKNGRISNFHVVSVEGIEEECEDGSDVCEFPLETEEKSAKDEKYEELVANKNKVIKDLMAQGDYACCLKKPCSSCTTLDPWHGEGSKCTCLDDVVNGKYPCGECAGGILAGRGNKFLVDYFPQSLADKLGEEYLEMLKKIISEKYTQQ